MSVLISMNDVQEFIPTFLGCLQAGLGVGLAAPVYDQEDLENCVSHAGDIGAQVCLADLDVCAKWSHFGEATYSTLRCHSLAYPVRPPFSLSQSSRDESDGSDEFSLVVRTQSGYSRYSAAELQKFIGSVSDAMQLKKSSVVLCHQPHHSLGGLIMGLLCPLSKGATPIYASPEYVSSHQADEQQHNNLSDSMDSEGLRYFVSGLMARGVTHLLIDDILAGGISRHASKLSNHHSIFLKSVRVFCFSDGQFNSISTVLRGSCHRLGSFQIPTTIIPTNAVPPRLPRLVQDYLALHTAVNPDNVAISFYDDNGKMNDHYTYRRLDDVTTSLASHLREKWGVGFQKPVLLIFPPGLDFFVAALACFKAGVIAVPVQAPSPDRLETDVQHLKKIAEDCGAKVALTTSSYYFIVSAAGLFSGSQWPDMAWQSIDKIGNVGTKKEPYPQWTSMSDVAFLQYTSGSTGHPKGVIVPFSSLQGQILGNLFPYNLCFSSKCIAAYWLPHFHDLGFIMGFLMPLCAGAACHYISPLTFVRAPHIFAKLVARVGANITAMPNFGFQYLVNKVSPELADSKPFASMHTMGIGAEPTRVATVESFLEKFHVEKSVIFSGYGMAENVLGITNGRYKSNVRRRRVSVGNASCFGSISNVARVVDPHTRTELPDDTEGEIWVASLSKARGYLNCDKTNDAEFHAELVGDLHNRYLRTGDFGFIHGGELFISGRLKNVVIIGGTNYYCQDIEQTVLDFDPNIIRPGCTIAFSVDVDLQEQLVILAEVRDPTSIPPGLINNLKDRVGQIHGVRPSDIALLKPRTIPKTTSGKLRHSEAKQRWINNRQGLHIVSLSDFATDGAHLQDKKRTINYGRIEHVLGTFDGVDEAVVVQKYISINGCVRPKVVAYICPPDAAEDGAGLKKRLAEVLPRYMIPACFTGVDKLPRTSSGEINQQDLPVPDEELFLAGVVLPSTPTEVIVRDAFAEVLGLDTFEVSADADFFELGGDSMGVARVGKIIQKRLGNSDVSLSDFFQGSSVQGISTKIDDMSAAGVSETAQEEAEYAKSGFHDLDQFAFLLFVADSVLAVFPFAGTFSIYLLYWKYFGFWCVLTFVLMELHYHLLNVLICVPAKWLLVGRLRPHAQIQIPHNENDAIHHGKQQAHAAEEDEGEHVPLIVAGDAGGCSALRWRMGHVIKDRLESTFSFVSGTAFFTALLRSLGARVERGAVVDSVSIWDWDLMHFGPRAVVASGAYLCASQMHVDGFSLVPICVNGHLDSSVIPGLNANRFRAMSPNSTEGPNEKSHNDSADSEVTIAENSNPPSEEVKKIVSWFVAMVFVNVLAAVSLAMALVFWLPYVYWLGVAIDNNLYNNLKGLAIYHIAIFLAVLLPCVYLLASIFFVLIAESTRMLIPRVKEGYAVVPCSSFLNRISPHPLYFLVSHVMNMLQMSHALLRFRGANVGQNVVMFRPDVGTPELVSICDNVVVAGDVSFDNKGVTSDSGIVNFRPITIRPNSIIGAASTIKAGCVLGPQTAASQKSVLKSENDYSHGVWVGAPAKRLFKTQPGQGMDFSNIIGQPYLRVTCGVLQLFCAWAVLVFPPSIVFAYATIWLIRHSFLWLLLTIPVFAIASPLYRVIACWLCAKLFRARLSAASEFKLGSVRFQSHLISNLCIRKVLLDLDSMKGSSSTSFILSVFGSKLAPGARYFSRIYPPEPEMLTMDQGTVICDHCMTSTHHIHDGGIFKMAPIHICSGCVLGQRSALMGPVMMEAGSSLVPGLKQTLNIGLFKFI